MRVIAKRILREFWEVHQDCMEQLKSWYNEAEKAAWLSPEDIKKDYPSVSILKSNRVIFNIKGNSYRLIVKINYDYGIIWIRFIGTHEEYDKIIAESI
jgi:mRNA interferase HigB